MQRVDDDTENQLRALLKPDEYAKFQAKRVAHRRARRPGQRPHK